MSAGRRMNKELRALSQVCPPASTPWQARLKQLAYTITIEGSDQTPSSSGLARTPIMAASWLGRARHGRPGHKLLAPHYAALGG